MLRSAIRASLVAAGILIAPLVFTSAQAMAATSRLALVIGQSAYRAVSPLPNPANDARAMAKMLEDAGFDVSTASDLSQNDLRRSVSDFAAKLADNGPDAVALVFYAGHGIQVDGENYLIPVDVDPKREADVPLQAVRLNDVLNTLASVPSRMRIIMLDACRNNPFPSINKTTGSGLAMVDARTGAAGTFISYSTSPGAEAEDGSGANSPYTTALLKVAREPGLTIEEAFKRVRVAVNQETGGRQVPWDSSSLTDTFNFFGGGDGGATAQTADDKTKRSADDWRKALKGKEPAIAYELVIADDSVTAYEVYVELFAQASFAPRVRSLLERRQEMEAWAIATLNNTPSSYQIFLARYGASDLAPTARKLEARARTRTLDANALALAATGPACPCSTPTPMPQPRPTRQQKRAAAPPTPPRTAKPPRRPPPVIYEDDVVIYDPPPRRPPPIYVPPIRRPPIYDGPTRRPPIYDRPTTRRPPATGPYGDRGPILRDAPINRGTGGVFGGGRGSTGPSINLR